MKKGPSLWVRFTLYPLIAFAFLLIIVFVVYSAAGYQISFEDGKIVKTETGIVIVNTKPGEADVYVDGELHKKKTPAFGFFNLKINRLSVGKHNIKISKDGYEVWDNSVNIKPGMVTWINYLILVPQERKKDTFELVGDIKSTIVSRDKQRELIYTFDEEENVGVITELNTTNKELKRLYEFLIKDDSTYSLVSYSHDKEMFFLRKTLNDKNTYIVYEAKEDGKKWDLTKLFSLSPDSLVFSPHDHNRLYVLKDSNLREINIDSSTQSAIIANNVSSIHYDPADLIYIQEADKNHSLWSLSSSNEKTRVVKALPASEKYTVSYIDNHDDYIILAKDDSDLIVYSNGDNNPTLETIASNVTSFILSPNEERIGYIKNDNFLVYDIEDEEYFTAIKESKMNKIVWLNDANNLLYLTDENNLISVNYDGRYSNKLFEATNKIPIISVVGSPHIYFGTEKNEKLELNVFSFSF